MKKWVFFVLIMLLACVGFFACKKTDDETTAPTTFSQMQTNLSVDPTTTDVAIVTSESVFQSVSEKTSSFSQHKPEISTATTIFSTAFGTTKPTAKEKTTQAKTTSKSTPTVSTTATATRLTTTFGPQYTTNLNNGSYVNGLPTYVPGAIPLVSLSEFDSVPYTIHYRYVYYSVQIEFLSTVSQIEFADWRREENQKAYQEGRGGQEPTEMLLVSYIKHYKIPRAEFDEAVNTLIRHWTSIGVANTDERYEIPNADIIYTFDNKIINEYYRRA